MLKNYFKIAWRNLLRNKTSSIINISGLAVGMAVAMLIGFWVWDELSFDKYHKNYDHIAQVMQHQKENGKIETFLSMPFPMGKELQTQYGNNFRNVVMASHPHEVIVAYNNEKFSEKGIYMDKEAPEMFSLKMIKGNYSALNDPHSIIIAASVAKAIFGNKEPLNELMHINSLRQLDVKVTGVYKDLPHNTSLFGINFIAPWDLYKISEQWIINSDKENKWDDNAFQTFVQIADNTDFETVDKRIINSKQLRTNEYDKKFDTRIFLNPMRDWHLRSHWDDNGNRAGGLIIYVKLFSLIGIFVLLLACINFMNLSTARSEKRAREVGIRKTIGSRRSQIVGQFYSESMLVVIISFLFSIMLVQIALPFFNEIANKQIIVPYSNPVFWITGISFAIISGFIAGSYPAFYLSSFKPIKVLKGTFKAGALASLPRKALVVLQFTVSIVLVICTIVVYKEVQYSKDRPIGYDRNGMMMVQMKTHDFYGKFGLLENDLKKSGAISYFAESSSPLTNVWSSSAGFHWPGQDPNIEGDFATIWITHDYGKAVNWKMKEGRDFSKDFSTDSSAIILNESAVQFMGLKKPVGAIIRWGTGTDARNYTVIGVVKDVLMDSPFDPVQHTIYFMDYDNVNWVIMKLNPNSNIQSSIAKIEAAFKRYVPSAPFEYKFADTEFATKFAAEERIGRLSTVFASLAIFISCLGLFGLASFVAEQRTREIGVRKVLGASVFNLWQMLSKDFVMLVFISLLIASPLAYYFMHRWLQNYEYRTDLSWWLFAVAAIGALLITILTVSFRTIKAAMDNPVKSLRTE